jgi:hypothetical protein
MVHTKKRNRALIYTQIVCLFSISFLILYPNLIVSYLEGTAQILPAPSSNYLLYNNPTYGISIQYPKDWQRTPDDVLSRTNINNTKLLAEFRPPDQSVGVAVLVENLVENMTLDQYVQRNIALQKKYQPDLQLVELNKTRTLTGLPGYSIVYNGTLDDEGLLSGIQGFQEMIDVVPPLNGSRMLFTTIHGDKAFVIEYTDLYAALLNQLCQVFGLEFSPDCPSDPNMTDPFFEHLPKAQEILDSLQITIPNNTRHSQSNNTTGTTNEHPCSIVDIRLATGEVTIEEHERLREVLEC